MIGHFSADELASYQVGTVSDGKAARISTHLSDCPQCTDVHSGLADVSQLLASVRVPSMPETLDLRLRAAIASESAQRVARMASPAMGGGDRGATGDPFPALTPGRPDLPERARRAAHRPKIRAWSSPPLLLRGLAAAGVVVLLVGGGILLANQRGPGVSTSGSEPASRSARNRPGTAAAGSAPVTKLRYSHAGQTAYANAVTSDVNFTKTDLPARIRHEVANNPQLTRPTTNMPATSAEAEPQRVLSQTRVGELESCLSKVATGRLVLLVEVARYQGLPATIIVLNPVDNAFDVIVVGQACGPSNPDIITTLAVPTK